MRECVRECVRESVRECVREWGGGAALGPLPPVKQHCCGDGVCLRVRKRERERV